MNDHEHWTGRVRSALLLLILIAIGVRVVYGLLVPLLPVLGTAVVLLAFYVLIFQRRHK